MKKHKDVPKDLPLFCDYSCTYASFGEKNVAGACRREQAVYCTILKKYNNKNNKCLVPRA